MYSSTYFGLLQVGSWLFLPDFATRGFLSLYRQIVTRGGSVPPQRWSSHWRWHYRLVYASVFVAYLSFNLFSVIRNTPPSLFQVLGASPDADDTAIKRAYRSSAKRYHPDRAGPESERMFIIVRDAYECLMDPSKRFGYERSVNRGALSYILLSDWLWIGSARVRCLVGSVQHPGTT